MSKGVEKNSLQMSLALMVPMYKEMRKIEVEMIMEGLQEEIVRAIPEPQDVTIKFCSVVFFTSALKR